MKLIDKTYILIMEFKKKANRSPRGNQPLGESFREEV